MVTDTPLNDSQANSVYLYCLTQAISSDAMQGHGIDAAYPLFTHTFDGLSAIVSGVDLEAFAGPASEANLQDINWVAPRAARHAEVVKQVMDQTYVMPVRFGTIFSTLEALERALNHHQETIAGFLSETGRRKEYALKGFMDRQTVLKTVAKTAIADAGQRLAGMPPGARYFEEKRIQRQSEAWFNDWLHQARIAIAEQVTVNHCEMAELKLQSRQASGHSLEMVLNWALLVGESEQNTFTEQITAINTLWEPRGITLEYSGPWPPYSFCPQLGWEEIS